MEIAFALTFEFLSKCGKDYRDSLLRLFGLGGQDRKQSLFRWKKPNPRLFFFLPQNVLKYIPATCRTMGLVFLLLLVSGCASLDPYLSREQEMFDEDRRILAGLLRSPEENFAAIRAIAFRHNPDVRIKALSVVSYHRRLGTSPPVPGGNYFATARDAFSFADELLKRARPQSDPELKLKVAAYEKAKLEVSQRLASLLAQLADSSGAERSIEKRLAGFFAEHGFSVEPDEGSEEREKIVRRIYETCGLIKGVGDDL